MAISRLQKEETAKQLREDLAEVPHAILVDFRGLNVEGATNLRRKLREGDARLKVVKNSTALRALEGMPLAQLNDVFEGQTAIAYTRGDIVSLAKTLRDFADEFETPNFKAGIVDGVPISVEEFQELADLPPREELIAKMLYLMNYPITGLATALNAILRGFVVVLEQIREKKETAGEVQPAAEEAQAVAEASAPAAEEAQAAAEASEPAAEEEAPAEEAEVAAGEEAAGEQTGAAADKTADEEDEQ